MSSRTEVTNESAGTYTFPLPYSGSLAPGASAILTTDEATTITNLGGATAIGSALRLEILDPATTATSHAALPINLPTATISTNPTSKAYVDAAISAGSVTLAGDVTGPSGTNIVAKINGTTVAGATNSSHGGAGNAAKALLLDAGGLADGTNLANISSGGTSHQVLHGGGGNYGPLAAGDIPVANFRLLNNLAGHNGAGAVTATGAKVGDAIIDVNCTNAGTNAGRSSFEALVTVNDQIQQSSAVNLSAATFDFLLIALS